MKKKGHIWLNTLLVCSLAPVALSSQAREFYTIIGPGGRPMVVPRIANEDVKKKKSVSEIEN